MRINLLKVVLCLMIVSLMNVTFSFGEVSLAAVRIAEEYQKALITGDSRKIESAWKKLHANPEAVQVLKETAPNAHTRYTEYANKLTEGKRARAENPQEVKARREAASRERIKERHPEIYTDDELAKAVETVHNNPHASSPEVEQARGLTAKKHEVVDSRRFAGGEEAVPTDQWRSHKQHVDKVVTDAAKGAAGELGYTSSAQTSSLKEGEVPKAKSDWDLYHDVKEPDLRKAGEPGRLTRQGQEQMQQRTRENISTYVEERGQTPLSEEGYKSKKIDNLPAKVENVGVHGNDQDFKVYAESANESGMEMYTCKSAVECEQIQRKMKEGRVDLERQGAYGAEQHRQERHHKSLGEDYREKYVESKGAAGPEAADERLFAATEVDAEGSKVSKHISREHQSRAAAAADIETEFGVKVDNPQAPYSDELKKSVEVAKGRTSVAEVEFDAARAAGMDDYIMEHEARQTAEFAAKAQKQVPALKGEAQRGIAKRAEPLNVSQRGGLLETARTHGGEEFAEGVRQEMIEMDRNNKAMGGGKHHANVPGDVMASGEEYVLKGESSFQEPPSGKSTGGAMGAVSDAAGKAADALRERGVRVPTQGQVAEGFGKGVDGVMIAGMAARGVQKERQEAAEEGRGFNPVNAAANAAFVESYEGGKKVGVEEVNESDRLGESRVNAAGRIAMRTADGLSGLSENQGKFQEEAMRQNERVQEEGRQWDMGDSIDYRARATARSLPLHDKTEKIIKEEMRRQVDEYGEEASGGWAKARAAARVPFEALHAESVFEVPYYDAEADRQAGETGRKLNDRRDQALQDMDDGLHDIALIEQRMRNFSQNPNQNDPWVRQQKQELLGQYTAKREALQRTNRVLGRDAGQGNGEYAVIRDTVALLPEQPGQAEVHDQLAQAMVDKADSPQELNRWKDEGYRLPEQAGVFKDDFLDFDAAGLSVSERQAQERLTVSERGTDIHKEDMQEMLEKRRTTVKADEDNKSEQMRDAQDKFDAGWQSTMDSINSVISQLNKEDAEKVRQKTQEAIALISQMQNGTISDEDFTNQLNQLENEYGNLKQQGQAGWQKIIDQLMNGQVNNPLGSGIADVKCRMQITMDARGNVQCECPGYSFNNGSCENSGTGGGMSGSGDAATDILTSVPADQIDQRSIVCDTTSKSGNNTPASISVDMKGGTGTANLSYSLYSVKDRVLVQVNGRTVNDTGCTNGSASVPIQVSGGDQVRVIVQPACAGSSTSWDLRVSCPK